MTVDNLNDEGPGSLRAALEPDLAVTARPLQVPRSYGEILIKEPYTTITIDVNGQIFLSGRKQD